jgi:hypothetical protein
MSKFMFTLLAFRANHFDQVNILAIGYQVNYHRSIK